MRQAAILTGMICMGLWCALGRAQEHPIAGDDLLRRFMTEDAVPLTSYQATRTMRASSRAGKMRATLVAATAFDAESGFTWRVVDENGSGLIRGKVLKAALVAEQRLASRGEAARGALTAVNYMFGAVAPEAEGRVAVDIRALRQDTMLLDGRILLSATDGDLLRVEGRLVKRPSFWTRRVWVTREYGRIGGVRVPVRMTSHADVLMAGASDFEMVYVYEVVNGEPVDRFSAHP